MDHSSSSCSLLLTLKGMIHTSASVHAASLPGCFPSHPTMFPSLFTLRLQTQKWAVIHLVLLSDVPTPSPLPRSPICTLAPAEVLQKIIAESLATYFQIQWCSPAPVRSQGKDCVTDGHPDRFYIQNKSDTQSRLSCPFHTQELTNAYRLTMSMPVLDHILVPMQIKQHWEKSTCLKHKCKTS